MRTSPWPVWGMKIGDEIIVVDRTKAKWTAHGIVAAQRRSTGQIWVVVAGMSGPGTYAGARLMSAVTAALPPPARGHHSPTLWVRVEVNVDRSEPGGDNRAVKANKVVGKPQFWPKP